MANLDTGPYYDEIKREIGAEVDYTREAKLSEEYARTVADLDYLHVPKTFPAYSSSRVLTMELVEGISLNKFGATDASAEDRWRVGRQLAHAILVPFVRNHIVHGDPHPGNFLVRPDGRLTILDFGAVKTLSPAFARGFWSLIQHELDNEKLDFVTILKGANFTFKGDLEQAQKTLGEIHAIAARPVVREFFDWGADTMIPDMRSYWTGDLREILTIQAPPESLLFYRAVIGLAQNLRMMRSAGPFRQVCYEIAGLRR